MAQIESYAHLEVIINGHRFTGWADEDPPFEFDFEESSERTRGSDGGLYALGLPVYGGTFTFKMFSTSPTTQWSIQNEQMRKDAHKSGGQERTYDGSLTNPGTGVSYQLKGGIIATLPAVAVPGQTYEGMIDFEEIVSMVDGGRFLPPLMPSTLVAAHNDTNRSAWH